LPIEARGDFAGPGPGSPVGANYRAARIWAATTRSIGRETKLPVRPLHVLAPLIKKDLVNAEEASKAAGKPYYRAAGEKMIEAQASGEMSVPALVAWTKRQFGIGRTQTLLYMSYADATAGLSARAEHPSLHKHRVNNLGHRQTVYPQSWHEPVKKVLNRVDVERLNIRAAELKRNEEREAERKLGPQLIDIGYKALATKLDPDKGGSRDAMARLNHVRDASRRPQPDREPQPFRRRAIRASSWRLDRLSILIGGPSTAPLCLIDCMAG
jgi:hypothetical protein